MKSYLNTFLGLSRWRSSLGSSSHSRLHIVCCFLARHMKNWISETTPPIRHTVAGPFHHPYSVAYHQQPVSRVFRFYFTLDGVCVHLITIFNNNLERWHSNTNSHILRFGTPNFWQKFQLAWLNSNLNSNQEYD